MLLILKDENYNESIQITWILAYGVKLLDCVKTLKNHSGICQKGVYCNFL